MPYWNEKRKWLALSQYRNMYNGYQWLTNEKKNYSENMQCKIQNYDYKKFLHIISNLKTIAQNWYIMYSTTISIYPKDDIQLVLRNIVYDLFNCYLSSIMYFIDINLVNSQWIWTMRCYGRLSSFPFVTIRLRIKNKFDNSYIHKKQNYLLSQIELLILLNSHERFE
jgi:hypothetical protein